MLFNLMCFNLLWLGLVLAGNSAIVAAALWLGCHIALVKNKKAECLVILCIALLGVGIDAALTLLGVFNFSSSSAFILPFWLITLWLCFAATTGHSLMFLSRSTLLQLLMGGLVAPLSYLAAYRFNAVSFGYSLPFTYVILGLIWAPLLVLCFRLQGYFHCLTIATSSGTTIKPLKTINPPAKHGAQNKKTHRQSFKKSHHKPLVLLLFISIFSLPSSVLFNMSYAQASSAITTKNIQQQTLTGAEKSLNLSAFTLVGSAKFSVFFWDIYHSRLFSSTGNYPINNNEKLLFKIEYLKDISAENLITRTVEQWQHLGLNKAEYQHYLPQLSTLWPNITAGDSLALLIENQHSHFYFNGRYIGTIHASSTNETITNTTTKKPVKSFGQLFIDIWLSPNTSQPKLRQQLLAGNKPANNNQSTVKVFTHEK